jgi:hypothetical protein
VPRSLWFFVFFVFFLVMPTYTSKRAAIRFLRT